ncbi:hypothetical protein FPZ12_001085 [Amycolatopsis acidicola]|uniref:TNase-like domain-containing protein n=1 Tax=Amycolatopsis acidicola TaxID=2596893 RepID=A0A5N0VKL4_9PSEU|nr:excalibur calcium-binding domain-containing protein [Amycolatopsis acidicola]KAA9166937.1 hypothetical protein FPZ12_001085 [Amycolatopsis acidicola]
MPAASRRRLPRWMKITLGVFGVLFVLGAVFGRAPAKSDNAAQATTDKPSSSAVKPPTYTVTSVVDGETVYLTDPAGVTKSVQAAGIETPAAGNCYATETEEWATQFLGGKQVTVQLANAEEPTLAFVTLADGTDFSTQALKTGHAKYVANANSDALQTAEDDARSANAGLWAAPCNGMITGPTPVTSTKPATTTPKTTTPKPSSSTPPPPQTTTTRPPSTKPGPDRTYYEDCEEVRAAGKAPLYLWQPGYRPGLDRDHNGVACE